MPGTLQVQVVDVEIEGKPCTESLAVAATLGRCVCRASPGACLVFPRATPTDVLGQCEENLTLDMQELLLGGAVILPSGAWCMAARRSTVTLRGLVDGHKVGGLEGSVGWQRVGWIALDVEVLVGRWIVGRTLSRL
ncbi:hypothetical protein CYMTET_6026 [Cymbomonas tetramitiformis]|uniref:Uncharacterized protein n=1 Tax=Cymbomonas tetramitiformis TaxID=36881 RepID=A0AAE0GXX8_9CHLO|nr:hypothetical protein CYMTET_6026 [Cymbomonas tetramitiformis]